MNTTIKYAYVFALSFFVAFGAVAQVSESGTPIKNTPRDGFYDRYMHTEKLPLKYDYIHQKDVFWEKRIWRVIDVREKMNHFFANEKEPLINIIAEAAKNEDITLYSPMDDEFKSPMSTREVIETLSSVDTIRGIDPETFIEYEEVVYNELNPKDVKQFRVKEVWFFDEETSSMGVRILGIAPIVDRYDDNGIYLNSGPMFWAYYPELRHTLATKEAFNEYNDAARLSWDDIFEARFFSSYITKQSNNYDRRIEDYKSGIDVLLEAEDIKNEMFNFEHDLWTY